MPRQPPSAGSNSQPDRSERLGRSASPLRAARVGEASTPARMPFPLLASSPISARRRWLTLGVVRDDDADQFIPRRRWGVRACMRSLHSISHFRPPLANRDGRRCSRFATPSLMSPRPLDDGSRVALNDGNKRHAGRAAIGGQSGQTKGRSEGGIEKKLHVHKYEQI